MTTENRVLDFVTKHWIDRSTGVSALDVSDKPSMRHDKAKTIFKRLADKGLGYLKENVVLYTVKLNVDLDSPPTELRGKMKSRKRNTTIFFPSESHLKEYFNANILQFQADGRYRNMLRLGRSQVGLVYFKLGVLKKYLDHQEKYRIDDNIVGGDVHVKDTYYFSLPTDQADKESFARIRYGKRKLESGEYCVSALLCDLADLPLEEQFYWASNEIQSPAFSSNDVEFEKFCAQSYGGMGVNHNDPIEDIKQKINDINALFSPEHLFKYNENSYVSYPVLNTRKNFADCCSELYKLIDDSSLNKNQMIYVLKSIAVFDTKKLIDSSGKDLSKVSLFNLLIKEILPTDYDSIRESFLAIRNGRVEGAHKITEPKIDSENYIDTFKALCINLDLALFKIKIALNAYVPSL